MKHREPESTDRRRLGWGLMEFAKANGVGISIIKRAVSWGNVRVVMFGDRPIITAEEAERIAREGLGRIPEGYNAKTPRPGVGRPRKPTPTRKAKAKAAKAADREARP
jgi:hypothetical protein